jgi:hypothetical protein
MVEYNVFISFIRVATADKKILNMALMELSGGPGENEL